MLAHTFIHTPAPYKKKIPVTTTRSETSNGAAASTCLAGGAPSMSTLTFHLEWGAEGGTQGDRVYAFWGGLGWSALDQPTRPPPPATRPGIVTQIAQHTGERHRERAFALAAPASPRTRDCHWKRHKQCAREQHRDGC